VLVTAGVDFLVIKGLGLMFYQLMGTLLNKRNKKYQQNIKF